MYEETDLTYAQFVRRIVAILQAIQADYLIGGAVASWAWGEPRATLDLDLVVGLKPEMAGALSAELEKIDIHLPADIILDNLLETRADLAINAIHEYSGYKAEMFPLRSGDDLRKAALARKVLVDFGPEIGEVYIHSPEDLVLYKLLYYSLGRQTKHLRDIAAILLHQGEKLENAYIDRWADRMGLSTLWKEIRDQAHLKGCQIRA